MGDAADRDLPLGHDLQQRRLHLGRRAVDLVGEHEVGEDRAELGVEGVLAGLVDAGADDVGRHQVGGELQAGELAADGGRQGLDRERLRDAGHALEQHVSAGEQRDEHPLDQAVLADDDPLDLEQHPLEPGGVDRGRNRRAGAGGDFSIGVLAALLTGLPGRAGPRPPAGRRRGGVPPRRQCPTPSWRPAVPCAPDTPGRPPDARTRAPLPAGHSAASLVARRAAPPVAARRPNFLRCRRPRQPLRRAHGAGVVEVPAHRRS